MTALQPAFRVIDPGLACTIQDGGRWGYQKFGVPVSGALDNLSLAVANTLVGNPPAMAAIEVLGAGLTVEVETDCAMVAIAGTCPPFIRESGGARIRCEPVRTLSVHRGDVLIFAPPKGGAVYYFAVHGGFDLPSMLGSLSTYRRAKLGGFEGRILQRGDQLPLTLEASSVHAPKMLDVTLQAPATLRVMRGPNVDYFSEAAFETLLTSRYSVSAASDRMGLRLQGPALERGKMDEVEPQGTTAGALQIPSDGQPIMLLADRQTTGGYPRIATVITADIPAAGRLAAGMPVRFEEVTREQAVAALRQLRNWLADLPNAMRSAPADLLSASRLLRENLIDGVTAGDPI